MQILAHCFCSDLIHASHDLPLDEDGMALQSAAFLKCQLTSGSGSEASDSDAGGELDKGAKY